MNNLRVDLIYDAEKRSASPINLKLVGRMATIIGILAVLTFAVSVFAGIKSAQHKLNTLKESLESKQRPLAAHKKAERELKRNAAWTNEAASWRKARIEWHQHLMDLQDVVPPGIQLERLSVEGDSSVGEHNSVSFIQPTMKLKGTARGQDPVGDIKLFAKQLQDSPGFGALVEEARVLPESVVEDKRSSDSSHRLFEIEVRYLPREFKVK